MGGAEQAAVRAPHEAWSPAGWVEEACGNRERCSEAEGAHSVGGEPNSWDGKEQV